MGMESIARVGWLASEPFGVPSLGRETDLTVYFYRHSQPVERAMSEISSIEKKRAGIESSLD